MPCEDGRTMEERLEEFICDGEEMYSKWVYKNVTNSGGIQYKFRQEISELIEQAGYVKQKLENDTN